MCLRNPLNSRPCLQPALITGFKARESEEVARVVVWSRAHACLCVWVGVEPKSSVNSPCLTTAIMSQIKCGHLVKHLT